MKLGISPLMPTANFLNKRYSIEMDFPDDSNPADNFKYLNEVVMAIHMAECPQFYINGKPTYLPQVADYKGEEPISEVQVDKPGKSMIEEMEACATPEEILSFRFTIKNNEEQAVYERKLSELSSKNQ